MKTIYNLLYFPETIRSLLLCVMLFGSTMTYGQAIEPMDNPLQGINSQLRELFVPQVRPLPQLDFLYDMSGHVTDDVYWTHLSYDTSNTDNWLRLYWEAYYMAFDTTSLLVKTDEELYEEASEYGGEDTILLGLLDISYYQFTDSTALMSDTYFEFEITSYDDSSAVLHSKYGEEEEGPYIRKNIFAVAPLFDEAKYTNVTYVVNPAYFFIDASNQQYYDTSQYDLYIDFNDGAGPKRFNPATVSYYMATYDNVDGTAILKAEIIQKNDGHPVLTKRSTSSFAYGKTGTPPKQPDETIEYDELTVAIYRSCTTTPQTRKIIIYLEGFDMLDFMKKHNNTAADLYRNAISIPHISQLGNFGYDFYVVDWPNSRRDMELNALQVVKLIDALKAEVDNDYEFIIMGESMGGVIARYALTYMESPNYLDPIDWPGANKRERMHNCRLMVSIDAPHQGANIPLAYQQMYATFFPKTFGLPSFQKLLAKTFNLFLDGKAAKQLLIYHIDTKSGLGLYKNYSAHDERDDFMKVLSDMGNYPQFCKKLALSNGALNGQKQTRFYEMQPRTDNDDLLDFSTEYYAKVLWFVHIPLLGADLNMKTNPNGQGQFFQFNGGTWGYRLKFYLWGVKLRGGYNTLFNTTEYADVQPYCTNAGGYINRDLRTVVGQSTDNNVHKKVSKHWLLNIASFKKGSDGAGCWNLKTHIGLNGFASGNFDISVCSDGMHFCFIPTQSALDYGSLGEAGLDYDFETDLITTPSTINSMTPFDVIVANGAGDEGAPLYLGTNQLNQPHIDIKYRYEIAHTELEEEFPIEDCYGTNDLMYGHWINREIGDDILYLDNYDCNRNSIYDPRYTLNINTFNNEWYTYSNGTPGVDIHSGFFSKSDYFRIRDNIEVDLRYDYSTNNAPPLYLSNYNANWAPYQGTSPFDESPLTFNNSSALACSCVYFYSKKSDEEKDNEEPLTNQDKASETFAKAYPNPNRSRSLSVIYRFESSDPATINISDLMGRTIYSQTIPTSNPDKTQIIYINLEQHCLPAGMYILQVNNSTKHISQKLIFN